MLIFFIYSAPCLICVIWLLILLIMNNKTVSQKILTLMLGMMTVYFYVEAHYLLIESNYIWLAYMEYFAQILTLSLFPVFTIYLRSLMGTPSNRYVVATLFTPALIMGIANGMVYGTMGVEKIAKYRLAYNVLGGHPEKATDDIYRLYDFITIDAFTIFEILWIVSLLIFIARLLKRNEFRPHDFFLFFVKGRKSSTMNVISGLSAAFLLILAIKIGLGRIFLINHHWIAAILVLATSVVTYVFAYVSAVFTGTKVCLADLRNPSGRTIQEDLYLDLGSEEEMKVTFNQVTRKSLHEKFVEYIENERPYLNPELSIEDVAAALSSNRTYVSSMMKDEFGTTFRSYINSLRVEAAKSLLLQNPDEILDSIAADSGFSSSSQLIKKFSEIVGESPRNWLNDMQNNKTEE